MKTQIENYIYFDNNLPEINAIIGLCTAAHDEDDLRERIAEINDWQVENTKWGFGHNHFWLSEERGRDGWVRILFVDLTAQN